MAIFFEQKGDFYVVKRV